MSSAETVTAPYGVEDEVLRRYRDAAREAEGTLCCPTQYDSRFLKVLPQEIIEKDYGCGDPSRHVFEGETVVDLGSGTGKICYILSQKVGFEGTVIGVDVNDEMLALARKYLDHMEEALGYRNVRFVRGKIQDLGLDLDLVQKWIGAHPIGTVEDHNAFEEECDRLRREQPLIPDSSVDVVVSNCVLNLVRPQDKIELFSEIYRVIRRGGRAVISDIVCDEDPTPSLLKDPQMWSGCISGAFREDHFLEMFEQAGFYGIEMLVRQDEPWQVVEGIEFRSVTVRAFKGKEGPCLEQNQAVVYTGPWKSVSDDDGHAFSRGQRTAVCGKTFEIMTNPSGPYSEHMEPIPPHAPVPVEEAGPFACDHDTVRHPRETKGSACTATVSIDGNTCCSGPDSNCEDEAPEKSI